MRRFVFRFSCPLLSCTGVTSVVDVLDFYSPGASSIDVSVCVLR